MSNSNTVPFDSLEERITQLELLVMGSKDHQPTHQDGSVVEVLNNTIKQFQTLQAQTEIGDFVKKYEQAKDLLKNEKDFSLSSEAKKLIILSSEDFFNDTARMLQQMKENDKYINSDKIQNIPPLIKKLDPIEAGTMNFVTEATEQTTKVEALLKTYNEIIQLLSEKFFYWDQAIEDWDRQIDTPSH